MFSSSIHQRDCWVNRASRLYCHLCNVTMQNGHELQEISAADPFVFAVVTAAIGARKNVRYAGINKVAGVAGGKRSDAGWFAAGDGLYGVGEQFDEAVIQVGPQWFFSD